MKLFVHNGASEQEQRSTTVDDGGSDPNWDYGRGESITFEVSRARMSDAHRVVAPSSCWARVNGLNAPS